MKSGYAWRLLGLALVVSVPLIGGCVSGTAHHGNALEGQKVERIQKGKTTVAELIAWFGSPTSKSVQSDGTEQFIFASTETRTNGGGPLVLIGISNTEVSSHSRSLIATARNGVVVEYTYSEAQ